MIHECTTPLLTVAFWDVDMQHTANIGESDVCSYRTDHILPIDKTMNDENYNLSITIRIRDMVYNGTFTCMLHVPQIKFISKQELSTFTFKEYNSKYFFVTITLDCSMQGDSFFALYKL